MKSGIRFAFISAAILLAQAAFAQCGHASPGVGDALTNRTPSAISEPVHENKSEDRTVLLQLTLNRRGSVREAKILQGPTNLSAAAIKAAKTQNYKHHDTWGAENEQAMTVAVTFPQGGNAKPEVRQAHLGGVPGCIYVTRIRVASQVLESYVTQRVEPAYPAGVQNDLVFLALGVEIDKDGNVTKVWKLSGPDELIPAAIDAVKKWKYKPYLLNGEPIEVQTTVWLKFPNS
jgi:Gram-negative bacterial TonB protein C-terminal